MLRRLLAARGVRVSLYVVAFLAVAGMVLSFVRSGPAGPAVTVTVETSAHGYAIPADFAGLSFESGSERPNNAGTSGYFFSPSNRQLVTLFENLGIHSLRMGGGSVDGEVPAGLTPDGYTGVDNLFAFAQLTGLRVIYSLRLHDPKPPSRQYMPHLAADDALIAAHVWRYRSNLSAFAIGNEPDWNSYHRTDPSITNYPTYLADWRSFAQTIRKAEPGAQFVGPDTGAYTAFTYYQGGGVDPALRPGRAGCGQREGGHPAPPFPQVRVGSSGDFPRRGRSNSQ